MKQQKLKHCSFWLYNLYMENKILQQNGYNALQLSLPIAFGIKIDVRNNCNWIYNILKY